MHITSFRNYAWPIKAKIRPDFETFDTLVRLDETESRKATSVRQSTEFMEKVYIPG